MKKHDQTRIFEKYRVIVIFNCQLNFLNSQLNEVVFMLQKTLNNIFFASKLINNENAMNIITRFKIVQTFEDIIIDIMRLRKTYLALLFLNYVVMHCSFDESHKFTLIFISSKVVLNQWVKAIRNHFSTLKFIIAHDERTDSRYVDSWVKTTTMKKIFKKLLHWSSKFENVFEQSERSVSRTMILFTYDIFVNRIVNTVMKKRFEKKNKKRYVSKWTLRFDIVILNEDHKLQHFWIKIFVVVRELQIDIHWFFTATFIINNFMINDLLHTNMIN
jgi:hypothetical protein